jgi:hypothetical protein
MVLSVLTDFSRNTYVGIALTATVALIYTLFTLSINAGNASLTSNKDQRSLQELLESDDRIEDITVHVGEFFSVERVCV